MPFGYTPNGIPNHLNFYVRMKDSNVLTYPATYPTNYYLARITFAFA